MNESCPICTKKLDEHTKKEFGKCADVLEIFGRGMRALSK